MFRLNFLRAEISALIMSRGFCLASNPKNEEKAILLKSSFNIIKAFISNGLGLNATSKISQANPRPLPVTTLIALRLDLKRIAFSSLYGYDARQIPLNITKADNSAHKT